MEKLVIEGGVPLSGTYVPAGNKNAALPCIAAALLTAEEVVLENVPRIRDVEAMLELLEHLGVKVEWRGDNEVAINAADVDHTDLDEQLCNRIRASFLLAGPLLARFGRAQMPPPGGDVIGRRRLDPHLDAFRALGATITVDRWIDMQAPTGGLQSNDFLMDEPSVMASENALLAASLTAGETTIRNAACEPHVQDVARMLVQMGAQIEGIGSNILRITGASELHGTRFRIGPDHIEVGSFIALAAATGGELRIPGIVPEDLRMTQLAFARLGVEIEFQGNDVFVPANQELIVRNDAGEMMPKVEDGPWPAFPADLTSIALALATQAHGSVMIFEKMFENRLFFVDKLVSMGANITLCDPHRAIVIGRSRLRGERLESPDIRAGMALLIAALCAEGRSEIGNIRQIDRGYERIDERLRQLGAHIERVATEPVHA
ncbi:MAG: UDP-N-acetylglucosamine 1-carboxyvinyltransferase [Thermoleophilaceae bacterium]|nr:UDP-N-acetylglucosamine 1-carboxyvinyltransferase [Thermoleophilaceae bacterium]